MSIEKLDDWNLAVKINTDFYGKACVDIARRVMEILDNNEDFDCHEIISQAEGDTGIEGITGFQAGCVAQMVIHCHSRGDEFKKKWNTYWGEPDTTGIVNPAILTIGGKDEQ